MTSLALLLAAQAAGHIDTVPPYLAFPEPGLDAPAAYAGYETRVYRDANGNAFQAYLKTNTGRVVHLWADAADESVAFTVRDSADRPARLAWGSGDAVVGTSHQIRSVSYTLDAPASLRIGLFLLGSMRVERDFQYAGRDSLPLDTPAFPEPELSELIAHVAGLDGGERGRHLALLRAPTLDALRTRLVPRVTLERSDTAWAVHVDQVSFDAKSHLTLTLSTDARATVATLAGATVLMRGPTGGRLHLRVTVSTDAPALTPLTRADIFNDAFRRFYADVQADTAHRERFSRLEREVRGMELLCYGEKLMAGLPNFATYFGRDMLMTAVLMRPVWAPTMPEHVIASALRKLSDDGDVSHEEALGGQAIRENAAAYNRLVARGEVARARAVLERLDATRENYIMIDDDFQLPVVVARYLADPAVGADRKRRFLNEEHRLARLIANLEFVTRQAEPYTRLPIATNLVSFPRDPDGHWISASWRDSRVGYGGGRFAMDVNVIWVPHALQAVGTILDALKALGLSPRLPADPLATYARDRARLARAVATWQGAVRHFAVSLAPAEVAARATTWQASLPTPERQYWTGVLERAGLPKDTVRFLAVSLDAEGQPVPIINTDPAMSLLLEVMPLDRVQALIAPITTPYPVGLLVDDVGPVAANDSYAAPEVWAAFRRDLYHGPTVVWGRDVNILLAGLASQVAAAPSGADMTPFRAALERVTTAVERSGLRHAELWSYRIDEGRLVPMRYGSSSDVQLWSLTDLSVQYLLANLHSP